MSNKLPADDTFGIAFETNTVKSTGILTGVFVTLKRGTLALDETVHVNLREHPLYPQLVRYVLANPLRKS